MKVLFVYNDGSTFTAKGLKNWPSEYMDKVVYQTEKHIVDVLDGVVEVETRSLITSRVDTKELVGYIAKTPTEVRSRNFTRKWTSFATLTNVSNKEMKEFLV